MRRSEELVQAVPICQNSQTRQNPIFSKSYLPSFGLPTDDPHFQRVKMLAMPLTSHSEVWVLGGLFFTLLFVLFESVWGRHSVNLSGLNLWEVSNYYATLSSDDSDNPMSCSCFCLVSLAFFCSGSLSLEEKKEKKAEKKRKTARKIERVEACKDRLWKEKAGRRKVYLGIKKRDMILQRVQAMFFLPIKETSIS